MTLNSCILFFSMLNGLDVSLVKSVISVESSFNPKAMGMVGELGLMQIRPKYVRYSKHQLLNPCTNVMVGTKILRKAKEAFPIYESFTYVSAFNLGIYGMKKIKHPKQFPYYKKIIKIMEK